MRQIMIYFSYRSHILTQQSILLAVLISVNEKNVFEETWMSIWGANCAFFQSILHIECRTADTACIKRPCSERENKEMQLKMCAQSAHKHRRDIKLFSIFYLTKAHATFVFGFFITNCSVFLWCSGTVGVVWYSKLFLHLLFIYEILFSAFIHQKSSIWTRKSEAKKQLITNCWASQLDFFSSRCVRGVERVCEEENLITKRNFNSKLF